MMEPTGTYVIELSDRENTSWRFYVPIDMIGAYVGTVVDAYLDSVGRQTTPAMRVTIDPMPPYHGQERRRCDGPRG
jgi:hypothetical protein